MPNGAPYPPGYEPPPVMTPEQLKVVKDEILKTADGLSKKTKGKISAWLTGVAIATLGGVWKIVTAFFADIFMWTFAAWVRMSPGSAKKMFDYIVKEFYSNAGQWAPFIGAYFEKLTGQDFSGDVKELMWRGANLNDPTLIARIGEVFLKPMLNLILPPTGALGGGTKFTPGATYGEGIMPTQKMKDRYGFLGAERFLGTNLQFQMSAWMLHFLGDAMSFGMFKSLKDLPNAISWSYGIGWLSWLVMGVPFRKGISEPMEVWYNRVYQGKEFTLGQAIDAVRHGLLTGNNFYDVMANLGYDAFHSTAIWKGAQKDLSDSWIRKLLDLGWITQNQAVQELIQRGYEEKTAVIIAGLLRDDRKFDLIQKIADQAGELYQDGLINDSTARSYLSKAGYNLEEATLQIDLWKMKGSRRRFLTAAQITSALDKKLITERNARDRLIDSGYTQEDADIYLKLREKD